MKRDELYRKIIQERIELCAGYMPVMGRGRGERLGLSDFQRLYQADPLYSWLGLDNPLMYAAHRAAGGMTSIYRQIGIGCERLFRQILIDQLGLSAEDVNWAYQIEVGGGKTRRLSLDGRIPVDAVGNSNRKEAVIDWVNRASEDIGVAEPVRDSLTGVVFEVRQGHKSKDSKRQNADIANAVSAYANAYLPCVAVLSDQIDVDVQTRYRSEKLVMLTGSVDTRDDLRSTYAFMKQVVGYDLAAFFQRNSSQLKSEIDAVLRKLLLVE